MSPCHEISSLVFTGLDLSKATLCAGGLAPSGLVDVDGRAFHIPCLSNHDTGGVRDLCLDKVIILMASTNTFELSQGK